MGANRVWDFTSFSSLQSCFPLSPLEGGFVVAFSMETVVAWKLALVKLEYAHAVITASSQGLCRSCMAAIFLSEEAFSLMTGRPSTDKSKEYSKVGEREQDAVMTTHKPNTTIEPRIDPPLF